MEAIGGKALVTIQAMTTMSDLAQLFTRIYPQQAELSERCQEVVAEESNSI